MSLSVKNSHGEIAIGGKMKKCDGKSKIRSKGKGRGLGRGKGRGPKGIPVGAKKK